MKRIAIAMVAFALAAGAALGVTPVRALARPAGLAAAGLLIALAAIAALPCAAEAQTETVLVRNNPHQGTWRYPTGNNGNFAQQFTTGPHQLGYRLESIGLYFTERVVGPVHRPEKHLP